MFGSAIKIDNKRASIMSVQSNKTTSTTKSALRASNAALLETIENISHELRGQRSLILDIQSRVTNLESRIDDPELSHPSQERAWWQATQHFVHTDTDAGSLRPETPNVNLPDTPPDLIPDESNHAAEDVSPSTPSDALLNCIENDQFSSYVDDIRTTELIFDQDKHSPVPKIGPVPSPKTSIVKSQPISAPLEESIRSKTDDFSDREPQKKLSPIRTTDLPGPRDWRCYKGVRSLATYEVRMNNAKTGKEHTILVHFHHPKQLAHLG